MHYQVGTYYNNIMTISYNEIHFTLLNTLIIIIISEIDFAGAVVAVTGDSYNIIIIKPNQKIKLIKKLNR